MTNKTIFFMMLLALPTLLFASASSTDDSSSRISAASFSSISEKTFKQRWQRYKFSLFGSRSSYQLITHQGQQVLQANSNKAASGIIRKLSVNLEHFPLLNWRWQTSNLPNKGDDHTKKGDDHSLRLYVIFDSPKINLLNWFKNSTGLAETHAINYIWANQTPVNTLLANPYTERAMMIAVNSGENKLGQWQTVSRNVYADYQRAFGHKPPAVTAIAMMTDTDNTASKVTSHYGDIYFSQLPPTNEP